MGRMLLSALPPEELDRMFCLSRDGTLQTLMSGPLTTELVAFPVWTDPKVRGVSLRNLYQSEEIKIRMPGFLH